MPTFRVMTLNLWGDRADWPARRTRLLTCLQTEEVDVLLLQEVTARTWRPSQSEEIARLTGYAMAYVPAQWIWGWPPLTTGLAILSRFPMSNLLATELTPAACAFPRATQERRILQRVELGLDGLSVVVVNTHLPLRADDRHLAAQRLWRQVLQEEAVLVVVGGDFNAAPHEDSIAFLQGKIAVGGIRGMLVDAWATAGVGPAETFPVDAPHTRIDYLFYLAEPSVTVQETRVIGLPPHPLSDHAAVLTTFAILPPREALIPGVEEPVGSFLPSGG
jgi:beta-glucosidase